MKKLAKWAALAAFLVVCAGCAGAGMVRAEAIAGAVGTVTARHDVYVQADPELGDARKATYLRSSELLRRVVAPPAK